MRRVAKTSRWRDLRGALRPAGAVIVVLALAEAICALAGGAMHHWAGAADPAHWRDATLMLVSAFGSVLLGAGLYMYGGRASRGQLTRREAILAVVLIWILGGLVGGLPFVLTAGLSPAEAFFETISGMTTTCATVITRVEERLSPALLLWRSTISWLGGMGIVVLFVAVFPSFGAGAKHMFKGEVPGTAAEGLRPRIAETSFMLWKLYTALTVIEAALLLLVGAEPFDAVCHALTTVSTCGFSTRDASITVFLTPAAEYLITLFMLIGSVNFALFYAVLRHRTLKPLIRSTELRVFVGIVLIATAVIAVGLFDRHEGNVEVAFRRAFFHVGSFVSSTGYVTDDYMAFPPSILGVLLFLMFVGGCSGSTAGGLKIERLVLMAKQSWSEFRQSFRPALVQVVRMGRSAVPQDILNDIAVFFGVYVGVIAAGVLFVSAVEGVSLPTAFGATLACIANSGPAAFHDGPDNFAAYSDVSKIFFAIVMLLGRLELFTIFALFVPEFWRR